MEDGLIGEVVAGRYVIERRLAQGGMCSVYQARHHSLSRKFALKVLSPELAFEPEVLARFRREAEIMAGLRHPNIVAVLDWVQLPDGSPTLVMELLEGEDLYQRLMRSGPLPLAEVGRIADQVLAGLTVVHRAGIVHRDLKPSNIFLARDDTGGERAVLLDFGISKLSGVETLTCVPSVLGTLNYMAPEQAEMRDGDIGPATDVWSMGAILYQMITGHYAFDGASGAAITQAVLHGRPVPISELRGDVPPGLESVLRRSLDRDRSRRPADGEVLRREVEQALAAGWSDDHSATDVELMIDIPTLSAMTTAVAPPRKRRLRLAGPAVILASAAIAFLLSSIIPGDLTPDVTSPETCTTCSKDTPPAASRLRAAAKPRPEPGSSR
jgi:serine/threonine protein kinase